MNKIVCSRENNFEVVDDKTIILVSELTPFISKKQYHGFPPLSKDIYKWCLKNKCRYSKVYYIPPKNVFPDWALQFKTFEACEKFRDHWVQCVVLFDKEFHKYEFAKLDNWGWFWDPQLTKEAIIWMKENHVRTVRRNQKWFRFASPEQAMAFKLRWT